MRTKNIKEPTLYERGNPTDLDENSMNTNKLKSYAPKARVAFMEAVKNRAAKLGIFEDRISDITIDGDSLRDPLINLMS